MYFVNRHSTYFCVQYAYKVKQNTTRNTTQERTVNNMKHTITMKEIQDLINIGVSTFMKKDNSPRGCECVSAYEIKPGDEVVIDNYFTLVTK